MKIGILAGEASGDLLGAKLIAALKQHHPDLSVTGIGGPAMMAEGCQSLHDMERLSVMGLVEPLFRLPELLRIRRQILKHFLENPPDVFIGIDSPDFNLGIEKKLKKAGIPVVHYVSPSVWAWRQKRIYKIAKATNLVLTLFPFETEFYKKFKVPATFVGHPLADNLPLQSDKLAARKKLHLHGDDIYIAVLPGSRRNELKYLAEVFVETAKKCWLINPDIKFISSAVNEQRFQEFQAICREKAPGLPIHIFQQRSHDVMAAADVVLVTSGTATLETMLRKRPMVIAYRMANMTYQLAKFLVKIPSIGLPNLLAGKKLVPEFIQEAASPDNLSRALLSFLQHPDEVAKLENDFLALHERLRCNASEKAARAVLDLVRNQ